MRVGVGRCLGEGKGLVLGLGLDLEELPVAFGEFVVDLGTQVEQEVPELGMTWACP